MHLLEVATHQADHRTSARPKQQGKRSSKQTAPRVIGCVVASERSRLAVAQIAEFLAERHPVEVFTDDPFQHRTTRYRVRTCGVSTREENRERSLKSWLATRPTHGRFLVDLSQDGVAEELSGQLLDCEEILWLVEPADGKRSLARLDRVLDAAPGLASRLHLAWMRREEEPVVRAPLRHTVAPPEFQLRLERGVIRPRDLARLGNRLERVSLGLALGGGGARGAAHVGVLRALENEGIHVDQLTGTSMGAFIAVAYAAGIPCERILDLIASELAAPWTWRFLPGGGLAHMAYMYRSGGWRKKARQHFGNATFENLRVPTCTVAADLAHGRCVVGHQGDAVEALLESINFPGLAKPILRDGMVVVDGGVLNNLPTDICRAQGADIVLAVDLAGAFTPSFGHYDADAENAKAPSDLQTLIRVLEVQMRVAHNASAPQPDILVVPEAEDIGFTDYARAHEIAERGETAVQKALPALKQLLAVRGQAHGPRAA